MKNNNQKIGDLGQHWTPRETVELMSSLIKRNGSILEPSAGNGNFLNYLKNRDIIGIEIDNNVIDFKSDIYNKYLNINFFNYSIENKFDTVIGNPPYVAGNLLTEEWFSGWKGISPRSTNSYIHFIEKCIDHLNDNGELIFIVPLSLFSGTSRGSKLRKKMMKLGSFTHVYNMSKINWDNAAVETLIFRWEKDLKSNKCICDDKILNIYEKNGFIWFIDYDICGTIGDFFKVFVGSAPSNLDVKNGEISNNFDFYIKNGINIKIAEDNIENWPRVRHTENVDKIFFSGGPRRAWPMFHYGNNKKHLDHVLIPKKNIDVKNITNIFNNWFKENGEKYSLIKNGRWSVGIKQFESFPINNYLYEKLIKK